MEDFQIGLAKRNYLVVDEEVINRRELGDGYAGEAGSREMSFIIEEEILPVKINRRVEV